MLFSVVISYNNVHEFTNNLLTLYEIKALTRMKSEYYFKENSIPRPKFRKYVNKVEKSSKQI